MTADISIGGAATAATRTDNPRRAIVAATVGNMLETYDFAVYGFFAIVIARLFFPAGDPTVSLLLTVATFGVGFVMRPVGALVLGTFADRRGRKAALSLTILMMAVGTAMIGFAPTYASIGAWAPAIIVTARLIQGFSAGGEIGTATAFLLEHAPAQRRGFFASFQQATQAAALLLGSLIGAALTGLLTPAALEGWGWRVPFWLGLLIGPVGFYIRRHTQEADAFTRAASTRAGSPLTEALRHHGRGILTGFGITIAWTVATYFFLVYMPTYAVRELKIAQSAALSANAIGLAVLLVLAPCFGALSDRIGRRVLLLGAATAIVLLTYPLLALLSLAPSAAALMVFQIGFAILIAIFTGAAPAAMAEVCPPQVRSTGVSIAYNFAVTIFGGFAPFIATWAIVASGNALAPAWYVTIATALSVAMIFTLYNDKPRGG